MNYEIAFDLPLDLVTVSSRWGILDSSPAPSQVSRALRLLTRDAVSYELSSEEQDVASAALNDFAEMFERRSRRFGQAVVIGAILGKLAADSLPEALNHRIPPDRWVRQGMAALVTLKPSTSRNSDKRDRADDWEDYLLQVERQINAICQHNIGSMDLRTEPGNRWSFNRKTPEDWINFLTQELHRVNKMSNPDRPDFQQLSWEQWRERLTPSDRDGVAGWPTLDDLLCATALLPPSTTLRWPLADMTLRDWSRLIIDSLTDTGDGDAASPGADPFVTMNFSCPEWVAVPAMRELRLPRSLAETLEKTPAEKVKNMVEDKSFGVTRADVDSLYPKSLTSPESGIPLLISSDQTGGLFAKYEQTADLSACILTPDEFSALDNVKTNASGSAEEPMSTSLLEHLLAKVRFVAIDVDSLADLPQPSELTWNWKRKTVPRLSGVPQRLKQFEASVFDKVVYVVSNPDRYVDQIVAPKTLQDLVIVVERQLTARKQQKPESEASQE